MRRLMAFWLMAAAVTGMTVAPARAASAEIKVLTAGAFKSVVMAVVPEFETVMRRYLPAEQADPYLAALRANGVRMERIAIAPAWVGVLDFQTRFPAPTPEFLKS